MTSDAPEIQPVTPSAYARKLLTTPWYRAVRWFAPIMVLAAVVIIIGPGSLPNGFSVVTLLILAGSNQILRRLPETIGRLNGDRNLSPPSWFCRRTECFRLTSNTKPTALT